MKDDADSQEEATHYFDQLRRERESIESAFSGSLQWDPLEASQTSRISWTNSRPGGFRDEPELWPAVGTDLGDAMARLVAATRDRIAALIPYEAIEMEATIVGSASVTGELDVE